MSNQESQNQEKTTEEAGVEKRRRFIKGAGIAAPVVLSLANRSTFGAQCLSQQISGNMSHHGAGSCVLGYKPALWNGPNIGTAITQSALLTPPGTNTVSTTVIDKQVMATYGTSSTARRIRIVKTTVVQTQSFKWVGTNYLYGVLTITKTATTITRVSGGAAVTTQVTITNAAPTPSGSPNTNLTSPNEVVNGAKFTAGTKWEYTGANPANFKTSATPDASNSVTPNTLPNAVYTDFTAGTTFNAAFGTGVNTSMREILNKNLPESSCVAALLNASTISSYAGGTPAEVKAMCNGTDPVPTGYGTLDAFFASTWSS